MNAALQQPLELGARGCADALDLRAALAEDDRFLAGALDMNRLGDLDAAILALFPAFGLDRGGIGQFLVKLQKNLLARDLGGQQALAAGRSTGPRERATGPPAPRRPDNRRDRRCRRRSVLEIMNRRSTSQASAERVGERQQRLALHEVDLVERDHRPPPGCLQALEDARAYRRRNRARHRPAPRRCRHPRRPPRPPPPSRGRAGAGARRCRACRRR